MSNTLNENASITSSSILSLGIESTAHTFGVGIVNDKGKVLSNIRYVYRSRTGIHPREASRFMSRHAVEALSEALSQASLSLKDLSIISFSRGPGLGPCLRTGATFARFLSSYLKKPLVGVNHCVAHIEIGRMLTGARDPVILYLSGGSTQVISYLEGVYRIFGETEDIAIGNFIDSFARSAGLSFPGGPIVEELARKGRNLIDLPYVVKGMNVSFSGLLTYLESLIGKYPIEDLCYSLQETAFSMLVEVCERAMAYLKKDELLLVGGVGVNTRLREMCRKMCEERGASFYVPPAEFCVDNGAMIAWNGILHYTKGDILPVSQSHILTKWRVEDVSVKWWEG